MESKYNITEIMAQVGDIGELISRMDTEGPVQEIDIDIVQEKIRKLYTDIGKLKEKTLPLTGPGKVKKAKAEKQKKEPSEVPGMIPEKDTTPAPQPKSAIEPATLADKFKGEKDFINERLGSNGDRLDLSSKLQSKPIRNIESSIGLNDRFKLINELFKGDKDSYQQTISKLDNAGNFNEAFNFITSSYDWDMEDEAVQMLLDLVRRKFIVNKDE
jgi:hypothetical protein